MTPAAINSMFRRMCPTSHRWLRRAAQYLFFEMSSHSQFCPAVPRRLESERVWVHPRFFAMTLDVEPHVRRWQHEYLRPGGTFFDVGAYVGLHSLYASRLVGKQGRVIAFEASPANAFCLEYHRRKNGLSQMEIVAAAVTDQSGGDLMFHLLNGGASTSNSIQCGEAYASSQATLPVTDVTVPMTNLDHHAGRHVPDLVKIDIEGAEMLALLGAGELMAGRRPPIILAAHPTWLPNGETPEQLIELLHLRGYEIFDTEGRKAERLEFTDYLCLPH